MEKLNDPSETSLTFNSRAQGCLLGALCGDAIGAVLEHQAVPTKLQCANALGMPGGGCHKVGKGQITDDGELTLSLAHGLAEGKGILDLNKIAGYYGKWIDSKPFDLGGTCRKSLPKAVGMREHQAEMVRRGTKTSLDSQSNGALMRVTPLCIWGYKLRVAELELAITEETLLTHPNQIVIECNIAYAIAIGLLLNGSKDNIGAYDASKEWAKAKKSQIAEWFEEIDKEELPVANRQGGWVRIGFTYAFYYLKNGYSYENAILAMLSKGGDTDTNCCIVGGLLGSWLGREGIPKSCVDKLLEFDPTKKGGSGIPRPEFLAAKHHAEKLVDALSKLAPSELKMKGAREEYKTAKK